MVYEPATLRAVQSFEVITLSNCAIRAVKSSCVESSCFYPTVSTVVVTRIITIFIHSIFIIFLYFNLKTSQIFSILRKCLCKRISLNLIFKIILSRCLLPNSSETAGPIFMYIYILDVGRLSDLPGMYKNRDDKFRNRLIRK